MPAGRVAPVRAAPPPTPEAVAAVEAVTDHDVIAFLTAWADNTAPREAAAYVHYGMTSSDLLDTALALQLTEATDLLVARATALVAALREHGLAHRGTLRVGRTHGIHAEPDVWGHRVADFAFAMARCRDRLRRAREAVAVGKLSGPVGTYSNIDPAIEADGLAELGLRPGRRGHPGGVPRRHRRVGQRARAARHRLRGDRAGGPARAADRGARAGRAVPAGQKGSSAMPHKKNPIRSERICGLARVVRGVCDPGDWRGCALWHERDISHSSVERVALPDAAIATDYLLHLTTGLISGLVVDAARMRANLDPTGGLIYTSSVLLDAGRGGDVPGGRLRAGPGRGDGDLGDRHPASGRRSASRPPAGAGSSTRPRLDEVCRPERYVERLGPRLRPPPGPAVTAPGSADTPPGQASAAGAPLKHLYSGKVREVYQLPGGPLLLVATDRISAYDYVLPTLIPDKGKILTQLSLWWFGRLADLVPNHLVDAPIPAEFAGRAMACQRLSMIGVECVARGYLAGSGWHDYQRTGAVCGVALPPGLTEGARLPEPIFTPATKAPRGEHDENIPVARWPRWWAAMPPPSWNASRSRCTGAARTWRRAAASSSPTPRSSSATTRRGGCCWPTRCSRPIRPGSGRPANGGRAARSRRSTSSSCATGWTHRSPAGIATAAESRRLTCQTGS